jgi:hypothetical protein
MVASDADMPVLSISPTPTFNIALVGVEEIKDHDPFV